MNFCKASVNLSNIIFHLYCYDEKMDVSEVIQMHPFFGLRGCYWSAKKCVTRVIRYWLYDMRGSAQKLWNKFFDSGIEVGLFNCIYFYPKINKIKKVGRFLYCLGTVYKPRRQVRRRGLPKCLLYLIRAIL